MPNASDLAVFLVVAGVLTITPGADMALVMRHTLASGRRAAFYTTLGICIGCLVHATAAALGVSTIIARSAEGFSILKLVGALYLVYLGLRTIRESRGPLMTHSTAGGSTITASSFQRCFTQGCLTNLLNPKVALFYLTFVPQFVDSSRSVLAQSLTLGAIHVGMGFVWLTLFAAGMAGFSWMFGKASVRRRIEQFTGIVLIGLGVRLVLARRTAL